MCVGASVYACACCRYLQGLRLPAGHSLRFGGVPCSGARFVAILLGSAVAGDQHDASRARASLCLRALAGERLRCGIASVLFSCLHRARCLARMTARRSLNMCVCVCWGLAVGTTLH